MPVGWVLLPRIQEGSKCRPLTHFKKCHPRLEKQDAYKFMRSCRLLTGWWDFTFYQVGSILSKDTQENWQKYALPILGLIFYACWMVLMHGWSEFSFWKVCMALWRVWMHGQNVWFSYQRVWMLGQRSGFSFWRVSKQNLSKRHHWSLQQT
jgi:hypothetical protein